MAVPGNQLAGKLIKPHGFKGDLLLRGDARILKDLTEGIPLFIQVDGLRVPFFIEGLFGDPGGGQVFVKFEFIDSEKEAGRYVDCSVFTSDELQVLDTTGNSTVESYIGYTVNDLRSGTDFTVSDYIAVDENPLLVLHYPGGEVLLPAHADFIHQIDRNKKLIVAEFPEGLFQR